ncbi:MAG: type II secretion system protein, partial [Patescibacteria group bacterium]
MSKNMKKSQNNLLKHSSNLLKHSSNLSKRSSGFTLIELLVVIFILGILTALLVTNLQGMRQRARDTSKKTEINNLKTALRLYYNDYQKYPAGINGNMYACGASGTTICPVCTSADFAAGGIDGCQTIYMKDLTENDIGGYIFEYYYCNDDDFRLRVTLENLSDTEIATSQSRCSTTCGAQTLIYADGDYITCAD